MHRLVAIWILSLLPLACEPGEPSPRVGETSPRPARVSGEGRLFVLQLGPTGARVLRRAVLPKAPRLRARPRSHRGRYVVRDRRGRPLGRGFFRLPTRVHALFAAVDGPAGAVDRPLSAPVVHLRVAWPKGARVLELWDGSRRLAEVSE